MKQLLLHVLPLNSLRRVRIFLSEGSMHITKVVIKNYRCLTNTKVDLNAHLNVLVGNNECGKSTFLEAVNLALCGLLNGRSIHTELHSHLFNTDIASEYIQSLETNPQPPPSILIELYLHDIDVLAGLKGTNNSLKLNVPGLKVVIEFNEDYKDEYATYIADPSLIKSIPVEYYAVRWRSFADNDLPLDRSPLNRVSLMRARSVTTMPPAAISSTP